MSFASRRCCLTPSLHPSHASFFLLPGRFGRILPVMKRWVLYLIAVPLGLGGLVYLVGLNFSVNFTDIWTKGHQARSAQREAGKITEGNAVPKEILRLRHKHQLRPLTKQEEGT